MKHRYRLSQQQTFRLALLGSAMFHGWLMMYASSPSTLKVTRFESAGLIVQINTLNLAGTDTLENASNTESPNKSFNDKTTESSSNAQEITPQDSEPSEIVFERPLENPGMSTPIGWGGRRYQNEEQVRARTVSDFMQKLQPLTYQINPERCQLQTAADGRTATLQCNAVKDQQQLLSGIGPFLQFTEQLSSVGACFTLIGQQITVTKKCAPF